MPTLAAEAVALAQVHGPAVLREAVASPEDLPAFDRSAMDGYAIRDDDDADEFVIVREIRAGRPLTGNLSLDRPSVFSPVRVCREGDSRVVMQEHVEARDERMRI